MDHLILSYLNSQYNDRSRQRYSEDRQVSEMNQKGQGA